MRLHGRLATLLRYTWASPCSLVGLLLAGPILLLGGKAHLHSGVLEVALPGQKHPPLDLGAITLGHVVLGGSERTLSQLRAHEQEHVRQYERWGVLFFLAYPASSLIQLIRGKHPYWLNHFEIQARNLSEQRTADTSQAPTKPKA